MRRLSILLLFVSLIINQVSDAQTHMFVLNDSIKIEGSIIRKTDDHIYVETLDKQLVPIPFSDIKSIYKSVAFPDLDNNVIEFYNISSIGMLSGKRNGEEKYNFSLNVVNGIEINKRFSAGLGMGIEFMDINIIPVFADIRWNILNNRFTPFIGFQYGLVFPMEKQITNWGWQEYDYEKGYFYNPMVGIRADFKESKTGFVLSAGFRHMKIVGNRDDDWWADTSYERTFIYDRLSVRAGFYFN